MTTKKREALHLSPSASKAEDRAVDSHQDIPDAEHPPKFL
jgi:hypothetical protein